MSQKECPSCGIEIDKEHIVCPICQYEFPRTKFNMKIIAVILIILFLYPLIRLFVNLISR